MDNTSGQGKGAAVPEEVKGLCWGGFFWGALWGIFNRVWLSLLGFVPVVGFIVHFVLLFKGREMAWRSKPWESVEHFNKVQRRWTIAALILVGLVVLAIAAALGFAFMFGGSTPPPPKPAAMRPAAPKPAVPKPMSPGPEAPKPAAPVPPPAPALVPAPAATVPATPVADAGKPVALHNMTISAPKAAITLSEPKPAPAAQKAGPASKLHATQQAPAAQPRPARVRATLPTRHATPQVQAAAPVAPAREPKTYTPRYNDVMTAVLRPDREGVIELLDLGRWVDKPDSNGTTPLEAAVRNRSTAMAELLLSRGANPNASGGRGVTPLSVARANGDAAMASLLQRHGAR